MYMTFFPADVVTREEPYADLASVSSAFCNMKHNTSPAMDGDAFAFIPQDLISYAPLNIVTSVTPVAAAQRRRPWRPPSHMTSNVPPKHSQRPFFGR